MHDPGYDQEQWPESPQAADGNNAELIEQEGQADQEEHCARDHAALSATAESYANHHRTPPQSLFFIVAGQIVVNAAMDLIAKVILELFRVKTVFVAHGFSNCSHSTKLVSQDSIRQLSRLKPHEFQTS